MINTLQRHFVRQSLRKKRRALILELFIALFILATCLLPLVSGMPLFFAKSMKHLRAIEMDRIADLTYIDVKTNLPKYLQCEDLSRARKEHILPEVEIAIDPKKTVILQRKVKTWFARKFEAENDDNYMLVAIQVILSDGKQEQKYDYRVIAQKKNKVGAHAQ